MPSVKPAGRARVAVAALAAVVLLAPLVASAASAAVPAFGPMQVVVGKQSPGQLVRARLNSDDFGDAINAGGGPGPGLLSTSFHTGAASGLQPGFSLNIGTESAQARAVAAGDLDGDGIDEGITFSISNGGTSISAFDVSPNGTTFNREFRGTLAGEAKDVVAGDFVTGDNGADEIAVQAARSRPRLGCWAASTTTSRPAGRRHRRHPRRLDDARRPDRRRLRGHGEHLQPRPGRAGHRDRGQDELPSAERPTSPTGRTARSRSSGCRASSRSPSPLPPQRRPRLRRRRPPPPPRRRPGARRPAAHDRRRRPRRGRMQGEARRDRPV